MSDIVNNSLGKIRRIVLFKDENNYLDMTNSFIDFSIKESLFNPCLLATITFTDTQKMFATFPINGGEILQISFVDSPGSDGLINNVKIEFYVTSIIPTMQSNTYSKQENTISLNLLTDYGFLSKLHRLSHRFKGKLSEIATLLFKEFGKIDVSGLKIYDDYEIDYISNFWDIYENVNYLCFKNDDMIFFETLKNKVFVKVSTLIKQNISEVWEMSQDTIEFLGSKTNVLEYKIKNYFDINTMVRSYAFGNSVYSPNLTNYNYQLQNTTISDLEKEYYELMGDKPQFKEALTKNAFNRVGVSTIDIETNSKRNLILQSMYNYNVECVLKGSLSRSVGDCINFDIPGIISDRDNLSIYLKGKWLITEIVHTLDINGKYLQNITLFKNAFKEK